MQIKNVLDFDSLGSFLRFRRHQYGFTQREMGAAMNITYQQYQKYEYGIVIPRSKHIKHLSDKLNVSHIMLSTLVAKTRTP